MAKKDDTLSLDRLEMLKKEIEALKSKKTSKQVKKATPSNVMKTMDDLSETLTSFMETFQEATEEMKLEEKEEDFFARELKPIHDKLDAVLDQNEKIAKGIIAVANMLNTDIPFIKRMVVGGPAPMGSKPMAPTFEAQKPSFGTMPPPIQPAQQAPVPSRTLTGAPMPPPPKPPAKKKNRFSSLFK